MLGVMVGFAVWLLTVIADYSLRLREAHRHIRRIEREDEEDFER